MIVAKIGVVGAGQMGQGIAQVAAQAGIDVTIVDAAPDFAIAGVGTIHAQVSPNGGEFQVNAYTTNGQETPAAVADGLGRFIVTFESYGSDGTDTTSGSIQVRRFAGDGTPLGTEIQVGPTGKTLLPITVVGGSPAREQTHSHA